MNVGLASSDTIQFFAPVRRAHHDFRLFRQSYGLERRVGGWVELFYVAGSRWELFGATLLVWCVIIILLTFFRALWRLVIDIVDQEIRTLEVPHLIIDLLLLLAQIILARENLVQGCCPRNVVDLERLRAVRIPTFEIRNELGLSWLRSLRELRKIRLLLLLLWTDKELVNWWRVSKVSRHKAPGPEFLLLAFDFYVLPLHGVASLTAIKFSWAVVARVSLIKLHFHLLSRLLNLYRIFILFLLFVFLLLLFVFLLLRCLVVWLFGLALIARYRFLVLLLRFIDLRQLLLVLFNCLNFVIFGKGRLEWSGLYILRDLVEIVRRRRWPVGLDLLDRWLLKPYLVVCKLHYFVQVYVIQLNWLEAVAKGHLGFLRELGPSGGVVGLELWLEVWDAGHLSNRAHRPEAIYLMIQVALI